MRSHFFFMTVFALICSVVIALISKDKPRDQWLYFWKFFGSLMLVALVIAWFMYFFPSR